MTPARQTSGTEQAPGRDYTIDVLTRAVQVLRALAGSSEPLQLAEIAAAAETTRSTAFRILWNLEKAGLAARGGGDGYTLGPLALTLGTAGNAQNILVGCGRPHVDALRDRSGETAAIIVRDGALRACIYRAEGRQEIRRSLSLGPLGPLWLGAAGRLLLANIPEEERLALSELHPEVMQKQPGSFTRHDDGAVTALRDTSPDIWSVAAPVNAGNGQVVAAIACTGPIFRNDREHLQNCRNLTVDAARAVSNALAQKQS